jgi:hypothetical protein
MSKIVRPEIGGAAVHIGDCHIWAAIYYLDSPTDYREFLPPADTRSRSADHELTMLDDTPLWWGRIGIFIYLLILAMLAIAGVRSF